MTYTLAITCWPLRFSLDKMLKHDPVDTSPSEASPDERLEADEEGRTFSPSDNTNVIPFIKQDFA